MKLLPPGSIWTSVFVTAVVALFVVLLPVIDQSACRRLGIDPRRQDGTNAHATALVRTRNVVLVCMLILYLCAFSYMVFFSRDAHQDYKIHTSFFDKFANSLEIDLGILELISSIATDGILAVVAHVRVINLHDFAEVYLNVMLLIPLGYLLPYIFRWYRAKVHVRPVVTAFLLSLFTENVQLVTKVGFYDIDDLITNTLGGLIGQELFVVFAFVVTNPDWRKDLRSLRTWRRRAKARALYPFARRLETSRTTILATDEDDIHEFYVSKLGFRLIGQVVPLDSPETVLLLELGQAQIEVRCSNVPLELPRQYLNLRVHDLRKVRARLLAQGMDVTEVEDDDFRGQRRMRLCGPNDVLITLLESYVG